MSWGSSTGGSSRSSSAACDQIIAKLGSAADADADAAARMMEHFPVDIFQTGSGTSTNMNANEVISNLACRGWASASAPRVKRAPVHPNDHVNMGQSSNDTFPTAMQVAACARDRATSCCRRSSEVGLTALGRRKATAVGRDHQDRPHAPDGRDARSASARSSPASPRRRSTASTPRPSARWRRWRRTCRSAAPRSAPASTRTRSSAEGRRSEHQHADRRRSSPRPTTTSRRRRHVTAFVAASGELKTIAVSLSKIANDIRWLGSGPRTAVSSSSSLPAIAARFVDHAGQGQPRDLRVGDAGRPARSSATTPRSRSADSAASARCSS